MHVCVYCQKTFSNKGGLGSHRPFCKLNPERVQRPKSPNAHPKKGSTNWAKGLTKDTDSRIKAKPHRLGKRFGASLNGHTAETKERLSVVAKSRNLGGYVKGSGRGKKGWYNGIFCDSSWELVYVIYCLDHNIQIVRNTDCLLYEYNGQTRKYIPDFIVDDMYVEIKGYITEQWLAKLEYNKNVKVLYEKDLQPVFEYVINKYGKDFIKLYHS